MFITLEGPDGSGKTTVVEPLKKHLEDEGYKVLVTREPGGTKISEEIRNVLLKKRDEKMDPWTEALLFIASRKQHLVDVIIPALKDGYIVICDRYMDSTSAYQGAGRGLKVNDIDEVQHIVLGEWVPNLTLYFNVDIDVANARMNTRDESKNRLDEENNDYKKKVISGYKDLIKKHPERFEVVDANKDKDNVLKQAIRIVDEKLKNEKK
ncbi:dTMP kinase [Mesoplasma lactucae]|uniref:Thymidylate kinase n=1 Tax=Mesoplasma lactucae ATCC 49193 TaxID=81460 RepID=A0A291ISH6_9MOLU|nr:dTMP kinase [Mesoplasma lactucae]ATG97694.1 dTMP kinase [Mesoplasma lactucae ATCC 49193]ATZ19840.1 thymidylate kinase [Mesoplasma lactucae ATCC 49193]MCL8216703.1 Thymidylate kinase [Mesoplasma lactucae ATCC 49193]